MKVLWIVGAILFIIGLGLLTGAFFAWQSQTNFVAHALSTEGVVTDFDSYRSKNNMVYKPVVEFTTEDGRIIHITGSVGSSPPAYDRGDHVHVLYDSTTPEHARIDSFLESWFIPMILGGIGSLFALVGAGMLGYQIRQHQVRNWLAHNGMRVQAKFEGVNYDTNLTVNGRHPWRLSCQWQHPITGKVYLFRSDPIWFDPTTYATRDQLDVMVNADNPKQYRVDTSFLPQGG